MQTGRLGTLVGFSLQVCGAGAAMIWPNEKWIGVAIFAVGLVIAIISLIVWFKSNYRARIPWTRKEVSSGPLPAPSPSLVDADKFGSPTVTQSPPTLAAGLYVSDIRFTVDDLEKNRRGEMTMRVFNGTGRAVEFSSLSGRITFSAPNSTNPEQKG